MITVTLTELEVRERSQALAQYASKLADLADEEEAVKANYKSTMAGIKDRRLEISGELRRLSRAVRLGVEERTTQRVLFEEEKRLEEFRQQQQSSEQTDEAERERLHEEAVANWRRERPATVEADEDDDGYDYQAEWKASLSEEERETYGGAACRCRCRRDFHEGDNDDGPCTTPGCDCEAYRCLDCDTKGGHQAACKYYVLGEGTPVQQEDPIIASLHTALHSFQGAEERWRPLQENGASDDELMAAISKEFGISGYASIHGGHNHKGGKHPQFTWLANGDESKAQTLKGKRLLAKVRDVMEIGLPGQSNDPDADHSAVYPDDEIYAGPDLATPSPLVLSPGDGFTAVRCASCGRIDGGHTPDCANNPDRLTFEDYEAFAKAHYKSNHKSHARKMELSKLNDDQVREWKQQQAGNAPDEEPKPKKKGAKLSPVEAAIDR